MATPDSSQANGLLCWLRCDEASGDLIDASDRHYDAQIVTTPTYQEPGIPTLGFGYGVRTNDAGAIATIDQSNDLFWNVRCQTVSAQAWFKANQAFTTMPGTKHALVHKSSVFADTRGWYLGVLPAGLGDADPASWAVKALPAGVSDVIFGNGVYVAVGVNAYTSIDGVVWTGHGALPIQCGSIAFGGGRFVAVGATTNTAQQAVWSTDGVVWNRVTTHSAAVGVVRVTYGAGLFVAVVNASGIPNVVITSPTGAVWTEHNMPFNTGYYGGIYYGNGLFVATAASSGATTTNRLATSVDGITWTARTTPAYNLYGAVFGGTTFIVVGAAGKILSSPTGVTWTEEVSGTARDLGSVAFGDGVFVANSFDGAADCTFTSPDGVTWTRRTTPSGVRFNIRFIDHRFIVVSYTASSLESGRLAGAATNAIVFRVMDAAGSKYDASYTEAEFTQFHHYVGTFDSSFVRLYRDSVLVVSAAVSGIIGHDPLYKTTIGDGLDGTLDDVAVWNRALTQAEVTRLYGEATFWRVVQKIRVFDTLYEWYAEGRTFAINFVHPHTLTIGPFAWTVQVKSGDEAGANPVTAPTDELMVDGAVWTTPAWVNVNTPHTIAAGTIIRTLTPGQTMTLQVRAKTANESLYATGAITVYRAGVVGEGLNIVLPLLKSADKSTDTMTTLVADYLPVMADGLLEPANLVAEPFDSLNVTGSFDNVASAGADEMRPTGLTQEFPLYENVFIDPLPVVTSLSWADDVLTLTGAVGMTNLAYVDLFWEVEASTGDLVIPVSSTWESFTLTTRQSFSVDYALLPGFSLRWRRVRFVAQANGPGSQDQAIRYYSPWVLITCIGLDDTHSGYTVSGTSAPWDGDYHFCGYGHFRLDQATGAPAFREGAPTTMDDDPSAPTAVYAHGARPEQVLVYYDTFGSWILVDMSAPVWPAKIVAPSSQPEPPTYGAAWWSTYRPDLVLSVFTP